MKAIFIYLVMRTIVLILAGGQGKRLGLRVSKPLVDILGRPSIWYVTKSFSRFNLPLIVVGNENNYVDLQNLYGCDCTVVQNKKLNGTGGAVLSAAETIRKYDRVLILQADDPLIEEISIEKLLTAELNDNVAGVISLSSDESLKEVGRIKVNGDGIENIEENGEVGLANIGRYLFRVDLLLEALKRAPVESNGEIYLTEAINLLLNKYIVKFICDDSRFINMNRPSDLQEVRSVIKQRILTRHLDNGVDITDPAAVKIGAETLIGRGTVIEGAAEIFGTSVIGENCRVHSSAIIDSAIGDLSTIDSCHIEQCEINSAVSLCFSYIEGAIIKSGSTIGPYAHIRPESVIGPRVKIGNFVEVKKSDLCEGVKVNHLSYIGDTSIGADTNVGCGTITANYDGRRKHRTTIGNGCFIGCNSTLIAPVSIGEHSLVAAGSTITNDVPADSLSIARERQQNKIGRAKKYLANGKS